MPVQGIARLRKHQFARQQALGTKVAATRAYGYSGVPTVDLGWTDPEVDAGSLDFVVAPFRGAEELTASLEDQGVEYDNIPQVMSAFFGGQVQPTGGGTAQTWQHDPASETVDENDVYTYEFGDDVLTDWYQFGDCLLESFEFTAPEGLGVVTNSMAWRLGSASSTGSTDSPVDGTVPTPGLSVDRAGVKLYAKDCGIYIADDISDIASGLVTDALHSFVFRASRELDLKRYADGSQEFNIDDYGTASRTIELAATWAKTDRTVGVGSESDDWFSDESVLRFIRFRFVSKVLAQSPSTFYSWQVTMPMRYMTREETTVGGNTAIILTAKAYFDPDEFDKVLESIVVCQLTEAELGLAAS